MRGATIPRHDATAARVHDGRDRGGGVSGLTAAALLRSCGIDSIVLERQARAHVEQRQRAGLVEHRAVRMFGQWGLGDGRSRLAEDLPGLETAGKTVPQQALVRGLIAAFLADGGDLQVEVPDVALHQLDTSRPVVSYTGKDGLAHEIECDFVAGCDGDRGVTAASVPADALTCTPTTTASDG